MGRRHYVPLRDCHDIPIRLRGDASLRRLGDVPLRFNWVFHLRRTCDVAGTYKEMYDVLLTGGIIMEYQEIIKFLDNTPNQPTKFRTKNWVEINDESRGTYNTNSQIRFKTSMLRTSLCDYSDAYILAKGTITVANTTAADADANNTNKKVIFKNYEPLTSCISRINK